MKLRRTRGTVIPLASLDLSVFAMLRFSQNCTRFWYQVTRLKFGRFCYQILLRVLVLDSRTKIWYQNLQPDFGIRFWYQNLAPDSGTRI